jgi:hypothetical protein
VGHPPLRWCLCSVPLAKPSPWIHPIDACPSSCIDISKSGAFFIIEIVLRLIAGWRAPTVLAAYATGGALEGVLTAVDAVAIAVVIYASAAVGAVGTMVVKLELARLCTCP